MFDCSCWISDYDVFYGAFCAPVGLILLFNLSMVLYIICSLSRRKKNFGKGNTQKKEIYQLLRIMISLSFLLGITWLFGVLVVLVDSLAVQYIFAILNTIQGFLIFILHSIGSVEVRKEWSNTVSSARRKTRSTALNFSSTEKMGTLKSGTYKRHSDAEKSTLEGGKVALNNHESAWSDSKTSVAERTSSVATVSVLEATELSVMDHRGAVPKTLEENEGETIFRQFSNPTFTDINIDDSMWTDADAISLPGYDSSSKHGEDIVYTFHL